MPQPLLHRPAGADPVAQLFPRVLTGLIGLFLAGAAWSFDLSVNARTSMSVAGLIAVYFGIHGLSFARLRLLQSALAVGLAVATVVFGVGGPPAWISFGAAALLLVLAWLTPPPPR